jgi:hypothetical protein
MIGPQAGRSASTEGLGVLTQTLEGTDVALEVGDDERVLRKARKAPENQHDREQHGSIHANHTLARLV